MLMTATAVVAGALILVATLAAGKPSVLQVRRSILIATPPEKLFALLDDFHQWSRWAPQDLEDPSMRRSFAGATAGLGAVSDWVSRGRAGAGRMQITAAQPAQSLQVTVDFTRPFVAHNTNDFVLQERGGTTELTWTLRAQNLYLMKLMEVFVDVGRLSGRHMEKGLLALKSVAEH
jgi:uncharacterized protein YndB with AHSA1/START domain